MEASSSLTPAIDVDEGLLARARSGEEAAWSELVEAVYPRVAAIVRNHLRRRADHEDVVQEVLLKLFLKLDSYAGKQPFEHWVSRISITTCYDWLRRIKARPALTWSDLSEAEQALLEGGRDREATDPDSATADASRTAMRELLDKLIAGLKPNQQVVIRLLDLEERSVSEVTELTGWGASKVKVTAMRARRKLGELIQELESASPTTSIDAAS